MLPCANITIGANEAAELGIVVAGLEIIKAEPLVIYIAAITEWVLLA